MLDYKTTKVHIINVGDREPTVTMDLGNTPLISDAESTASFAHKKSPIEKLPAELLVMLGEQMSFELAAAFTLASKTLYDKLGNKFLSDLPGQRREKRRFLDLLARETLHYFRCATSENLHPYTYPTATETFRSGLFGTFTASKSYEENTSDWQLQHWTEHGL